MSEDVVTDGFLIGVNLLIACVLVSLALFLTNSGKSLTSTFSSKLSNINTNLTNDEFMQYDGTTVKGADVVNCIKKHLGDLDIKVIKNCGPDAASATLCTWDTSSAAATGQFVNLPSYAEDDMSGNPLGDGQIYINPNAEFKGKIERNANGAITGITFTQVGYRQDAYEVPDAGNTTIVINNGSESNDDAMLAAIASLNSAAVGLNQAISDLQQNGTGGDDIQEQTLAILNTMSGEILPGISDQIASLQNITGVDPKLSQNIADLQGKVNALYELFNSSGLSSDKTTHNADEIYTNLDAVRGYVTEIAATTTTMHAQLSDVQAKLESLKNQMTSEHAAILAALASIQSTQDAQTAMLQSILTQVSQRMSELRAAKIKINEQQALIESLEEEISRLQSSSSYTMTREDSQKLYNDMSAFSQKDAETLQKVNDVTNQFDQIVQAVDSINSSYKTLDEWLQAHPGGNL